VLRKVAEFKVMGTSADRFDGPDKVTGRAVYAADVRRPGMLYASVLRPPAHGAELRRLDTAKAAAVPGVTVVEEKNLVAVLHADPEVAAEALRRVEADWSSPEATFDTETVDAHLRSVAPPPEVPQEAGDVATARAAAGRVFTATYRTGYVAHAPMEPHVAVAEVADGRLTVWASTQSPFPLRDRLVEELGLPADAVRVVTPYVGGGFGGKSAGGQAVEAARLARRTGRPVQVAWTRDEEFFYDPFDPAAVVDVASAVGADGRLALWDYQVWAAGDRGAELFYDAPHVLLRAHGSLWGPGTAMHPFAVGPWRAPGANTNVFAMESQMDLMAAVLGVDPLEFRLRNLEGDPRMRRVLETAAQHFGWRPGRGPSGQGRAIACGVDAGTYVALCAQVAVDRESGEVTVERVVCAQDMGIVVNPEGAIMQAEGCIIQGLGYVLSEELRFRGGRILDRNFGTYHLPTFRRLPAIDVVLVRNDELDPQGGGEPAIVPMGAVVANAVFDATGVRLYRLPMTAERVKAALAAAQEEERAAAG
jgi:isoquinoline 1-oxidoreductase